MFLLSTAKITFSGGLLLIILLYNHVAYAKWSAKSKQIVRVTNIISVEKEISLLSCQIRCDLQKDCFDIGTDENLTMGMMGGCYLLRRNEHSENGQTISGTSFVTKEMYVYQKHDLCNNAQCRDDQKCVVTGARYICVCRNGLSTDNCKFPLSCDAIKKSKPKTPSGFYVINPSKPVFVYCDMDIDTNGWMMIANITLPNPIPNAEATMLSSVRSLSNKIEQLSQVSSGRFRLNPVHLADFDASFKYLHFYCKKPRGTTVSITTLTKNILDYFLLKTDLKPAACSSFKRLTEDTSSLTQDCAKWKNSQWGGVEKNGNRLYAFPFYVNYKSHYGISSSRYECDDYLSKNAGIWRIYVR